jgi:hypothetical protein
MTRASSPKPSRRWFAAGRLMATPAALALFRQGLSPAPYLLRHLQCDWGDLCQEDRLANDAALTRGQRLLFGYDVPPAFSGPRAVRRLWILTESDRSLTTIWAEDR